MLVAQESWIQHTVFSGSLVLAAPVALFAGLVSFFSPCVVPLLPGYLSYMTGVGVQDLAQAHRRRMVSGAMLFVAGFSAVYISGGALFGYVGGQIKADRGTIDLVAGLLLVAMGLGFIGLLPLLQRDVRVHAVPAVGLLAAPLLGALFGLGWSPCIGPTLTGVLALSGSEGTAVRGALLTAIYCAGLGIPFVVAALFFARFSRITGWVRAHQRAVSVIGGLVLIVTGLALATGWWNDLVITMQGWLSGFEAVI